MKKTSVKPCMCGNFLSAFLGVQALIMFTIFLVMVFTSSVFIAIIFFILGVVLLVACFDEVLASQNRSIFDYAWGKTKDFLDFLFDLS